MRPNLKEKPYCLSPVQIEKIELALSKMNVDEKIGQLFFVIGQDDKQVDYSKFIKKYQPGGVMYRADQAEKIKRQIDNIQRSSKIPLFTAANLEAGGNGIVSEGTYVGQPMGIAATNNPENAYHLGKIAGKEGHSVGVNMAFAPIVDIDMNFKNPITNVRTFGSEAEKVLSFSKKQIEGFQEENVIPVIKHFPGDGVDDRDQHLLTSINYLDSDTWLKTYGKVYQGLIDNGVTSVMIAHIAFPDYVKQIDEEKYLLPASLSQELVNGLLRKELSFNGLTITDATPMIGYNTAIPRAEALPTSIAAGVDMILFNKNIDEDYQAMKAGIRKGIVTEEQIDHAVLRILGTKVAHGIWVIDEEIKAEESRDLSIIGSVSHHEQAKKIADQAVTLVRDTENLLPITLEKYPRIRLYILGDKDEGGFKQGGVVGESFIKKLQEEGFEVTVYSQEQLDFHEIFEEGISNLKEKFDLALYLANIENASNQTTTRINWIQLMAANAPWFVRDIPTIFISTANPYHLYDVPMISTFINAYSSNEETILALISKLLGKAKFVGISPVNPFVNQKLDYYEKTRYL